MFLESNPTQQKDAIRHFYDRLSPHFRELWGPHLHDGYYLTGQETKERAQEMLVEFLAGMVKIPKGSRVLDVGCGMGGTSVWLAEHLDSFPTGVTLSPQQVDMANSLAKERGVKANFLVMDAEELEFEEQFDAVWMVGVLGHLPNQERFLSKAHKLLKPGGRFLLADWTLDEKVSDSDYDSVVKPVIKGMLMPTIATASNYKTWFKEGGFRVVDSADITKETSRTWDQSIQIIQAPKALKLALSLGKDVLELYKAIRYMKVAMKKEIIHYSVVVAQKEPSSD